MLENYGGNLPFWLAPRQVAIATITDSSSEYAYTLFESLESNNIRVHLDDRNEQIGYKIREHSLLKIPYIVAVGSKEVQNNSVSVRTFGSEKTTTITKEDFLTDCLSKNINPS